jgi:hypothetical protein
VRKALNNEQGAVLKYEVIDGEHDFYYLTDYREIFLVGG